MSGMSFGCGKKNAKQSGMTISATKKRPTPVGIDL